MREVLGADPEGTRRLEAWCWTDREATPREIRPWVVRRWSVEVPGAESRALLGLETPRSWSDRAMARTTPVWLAGCALVTVLALPWRPGGPRPVPVTAWSHNTAPTVADCWALGHQHRWRARAAVHSAAEPACGPWPREAVDR
jgi:hypothetical protein